MSEEEKQYFFNFSFFKIDPKWRWMADLAKEESARITEYNRKFSSEYKDILLIGIKG